MNKEEGIVIAADVDSLRKLRHLAEASLGIPEIVAIKVGCILGLTYGMRAVVDTIKSVSGLAVIYDHQKLGGDIPAMGEPFAKVFADLGGVDGVIIFPSAGPSTLIGFVSPLFDRGIKPIVGLTMSHKTYLESEGGWIAEDAPRRIADIALSIGVKDFVLPGNKLEFVKNHSRVFELGSVQATIWMPGIGTQGGEITSAFKAAKPHARRAIIGSKIYKDPDPRAAMLRFAAEVKS